MSREALRVELHEGNNVRISRDSAEIVLSPMEIGLILEVANEESNRRIREIDERLAASRRELNKYNDYSPRKTSGI